MKDGCQCIGVWRLRDQFSMFRYPRCLHVVEGLLAYDSRPASSVLLKLKHLESSSEPLEGDGRHTDRTPIPWYNKDC